SSGRLKRPKPTNCWRTRAGRRKRPEGAGMSTPTRPIASIKIGPRFRKEHRNIAALAKNIAEIGLIHPVVITPGGELICGEGRIKACLSLGWKEVPVRRLCCYRRQDDDGSTIWHRSHCRRS